MRPDDPVTIADFLVDPRRAGEDPGRPLAIVEMARWRADTPGHRPACPVIGLGDPAHPLAAWVDTVIEPPVSVESVMRQILHAPRAAAVAVAMLRRMEGLAPETALDIESLGYGLLQGSAEHASWLARRPAAIGSRPGGAVRLARDGDRLRVTLDRPAARNAIGVVLRDGLNEAFALAALDPDIRRVSLTATGPAFSIGGDLDEFGITRDPARAHAIRAATLPARAMLRAGKPIEAHVRGACIGAGLEIAAFADRLSARRDAWFQLPELAMGLVPGAGGCVSVPRRIGRSRAALMILSGRRIGAETASGWGLVDAIEDEAPGDPGGADP